MVIEYTLQAKEDLDYWKKSNNIPVLKKIQKLIEAINQSQLLILTRREILCFSFVLI
jgi:Txe/YoeB family toxin of Txe-Axe toxin-antitoxin module